MKKIKTLFFSTLLIPSFLSLQACNTGGRGTLTKINYQTAIDTLEGTDKDKAIDYSIEFSDINSYQQLINDKEDFILTIEGLGCSSCNSFIRNSKKYFGQEEILNYSIDVNVYKELSIFGPKASYSTPTMFFLVGGQITDTYYFDKHQKVFANVADLEKVVKQRYDISDSYRSVEISTVKVKNAQNQDVVGSIVGTNIVGFTYKDVVSDKQENTLMSMIRESEKLVLLVGDKRDNNASYFIENLFLHQKMSFPSLIFSYGFYNEHLSKNGDSYSGTFSLEFDTYGDDSTKTKLDFTLPQYETVDEDRIETFPYYCITFKDGMFYQNKELDGETSFLQQVRNLYDA